ncbi:Myb-like DNA-binding domain containing protein [Tritrichomonas foetus]|uniref:Myb-like DNA-binding domain containing protein n=1 Tax=Tritrichomonas foetus TaxID=1144522 RepID=A0A1J4JHM1_9EUKA|nr:Myb-like DNA-binding domain containing protein [Tritrichomonas foetus]|eukprot:OHS98650.1 Myb-like DNA-binding domain containing protein [Tritrichomonas foetus]
MIFMHFSELSINSLKYFSICLLLKIHNNFISFFFVGNIMFESFPSVLINSNSVPKPIATKTNPQSRSVMPLRNFSRPKRRRSNFTLEENSLLLSLIEKHGRDWGLIASYFEGRTPRSCKDHYENVLSGTIKKAKFTPDEDLLLIQLYSVHGPRWSIIGQFFPERTTISLRNRYASLQTKHDRLLAEVPRIREDLAYYQNYCPIHPVQPIVSLAQSNEENPTVPIQTKMFPPIRELNCSLFNIKDMYKISSLLV